MRSKSVAGSLPIVTCMRRCWIRLHRLHGASCMDKEKARCFVPESEAVQYVLASRNAL